MHFFFRSTRKIFEVHATPCYIFIVFSNIPLPLVLSSEDLISSVFFVEQLTQHGRVIVFQLLGATEGVKPFTTGDQSFPLTWDWRAHHIRTPRDAFWELEPR